MTARSTKDRIVDGAVQLFNKDGVGPVTTNHIAAHLGMSPGNLYYHFKNKEEIVRAAFDRMMDEAEQLWSVDESWGPFSIHRILTGNIALYARYTFFARELSAILRADPTLKRRYRKIHAARFEQLERALKKLVDLELLTGLSEDDLPLLIENAWTVGLFGIPSGELVSGSRSIQDEITHSARQMLHLFKPYMAKGAYEVLVTAVNAGVELAARDVPALRSPT